MGEGTGLNPRTEGLVQVVEWGGEKALAKLSTKLVQKYEKTEH